MAARANVTLLRFARKLTQSDRQRPEDGPGRPDPAAAAGQAVTARQVRAAMAMLGSEQRQVIVEMYFRGRSVAEVAEVLGVPAGTVQSRGYDGLHELRRALMAGGGSLPGADRLSA